MKQKSGAGVVALQGVGGFNYGEKGIAFYSPPFFGLYQGRANTKYTNVSKSFSFLFSKFFLAWYSFWVSRSRGSW